MGKNKKNIGLFSLYSFLQFLIQSAFENYSDSNHAFLRDLLNEAVWIEIWGQYSIETRQVYCELYGTQKAQVARLPPSPPIFL